MKHNSGQMMIEVLFALTIMAIILLALTAAAVISIKNARFAKNVVLANQHAQEALEVSRQERDRATTWDDFKTEFSGNMGFGSGDEKPNGTCPTDANLGIFKRCVDFDNTDPSGNKSLVTVTVSWSEAGRDHQSQSATILSLWTN